MLDIKLIRENPELVNKGLESKNVKDGVNEILSLDSLRREKLQLVEDLKAKRNSASQEIGKKSRAKCRFYHGGDEASWRRY